MKNNKEIQNYKIFEVSSIQKKRWEGEIAGAGASFAGGYYFASLFLFRFFWRQKKNERSKEYR